MAGLIAYIDILESSSLKDTKRGASATLAGWQRIPVTNCARKEAKLIVITGGRDLSGFQGVLGS